MDLAGKTMLAQQLGRLKQVSRVDEIVVATTTNMTDDPVIDVAEREGVRWYRGSEQDVLSRYDGAARESGADVVVRVTSDCPLIDPGVIADVIEALTFDASASDYSSNVVQRTYPRGLDTEALFADTLFRVSRMARSASAREHVTHFILVEHPALFLVQSVTDAEDNSDLRWTVDFREDLELVRRIYSDLGLSERNVAYREIVQHMREHPEISKMNAGF